MADPVERSSERSGPRTSAAEVVRVTAIAAATLGALVLFWYAARIFLILFGACLFAIFVNVIAVKIEDWTSLGHKWATALTGVLLLGLAIVTVWIVAPRIENQVIELSETLPAQFEKLKEDLAEQEFIRPFIREVEDTSPEQAADLVTERAGSIFNPLSAATTAIAVVLAAGFYLAFSPTLYRDGFLLLVPPGRRERARYVLHRLYTTMVRWIVGRVLSMIIVGVLTYVALLLIGLPLALTLALISAIFSFVPFVGTIASAVLAALIGLADSPQKAVWVVVAYVVVQLIEGYLITPFIQKQAVKVPPALLVGGQLLAGFLFGAIGVILSTPLLAVALVLVKTLYIEGRSSDPLAAEMLKEEAS